jgi:hypothetical protein
MAKLNKFVLSIFLLLFLPIVQPIGLMSVQPEETVYKPGQREVMTFFVKNNAYDFEAYTSGILAGNVTLSPIAFDPIGMYRFTVTVDYPETIELEPGVHILYVGVRETGVPGGTVGALTAVQKRIKVEIYSTEKLIKALFDAPDANENQIMNFRLNVQSVTYQDIALVLGRITIYDENNNSLATFDTDKASLSSGEKKTLEARWNNSMLAPGNYRAEALVIYDGKTMVLEDDFKVGTLMIRIIDYTDEFISGEVNEFNVELENVWNNRVNDIYAELFIEDEKVLKTATINLDPWETGDISSYWNVTLPAGEYNGKIRLYYAGASTEKNIKVTIKEPRFRLSAENKFALISFLLLIVILLLIIVIVRLLIKDNKHEKKKTRTAKTRKPKKR